MSDAFKVKIATSPTKLLLTNNTDNILTKVHMETLTVTLEKDKYHREANVVFKVTFDKIDSIEPGETKELPNETHFWNDIENNYKATDSRETMLSFLNGGLLDEHQIDITFQINGINEYQTLTFGPGIKY